jgi:hypothetical protein
MDHEVFLELREVHNRLGQIAESARQLKATMILPQTETGTICELVAQLTTQTRIMAHIVERLVELHG